MLSGDVSPMQIENCADDLLQDSFAAANDRKVPLTLHVAQGVLEHLPCDPARHSLLDPLVDQGRCQGPC
jgi:hypothetical protein